MSKAPDTPECDLHQPSGAAPLPGDMRYEEWYRTDAGRFALLAQEAMVRRMTFGWPRRGHNLLEICCGSGHFLAGFWQSGFDVTGQEQSPYLLGKARERLQCRADFTQGNPEHLPYDDNSFDYVVCLNGLEFSPQPLAMLEEMFRLASLGVLLAFPSSWSWHYLGYFLAGKIKRRKKAETDSASGFSNFISPWKVQGSLRKFLPDAGSINWGANLLGPRFSWKIDSFLGRLNLLAVPFPLGATSLVRINLLPALAGNQMLISNKPTLASEAAAGGMGRVSKKKMD